MNEKKMYENWITTQWRNRSRIPFIQGADISGVRMQRLKGERLDSYLYEFGLQYNPNWLYLTTDWNSRIRLYFDTTGKRWLSAYGCFATEKMDIMPIISKIQVSVLKAKWQDKLPDELWNLVLHFLSAQSND
jgi:hypothetical protein